MSSPNKISEIRTRFETKQRTGRSLSPPRPSSGGLERARSFSRDKVGGLSAAFQQQQQQQQQQASDPLGAALRRRTTSPAAPVPGSAPGVGSALSGSPPSAASAFVGASPSTAVPPLWRPGSPMPSPQSSTQSTTTVPATPRTVSAANAVSSPPPSTPTSAPPLLLQPSMTLTSPSGLLSPLATPRTPSPGPDAINALTHAQSASSLATDLLDSARGSSGSGSESVKVAVRVRPLISRENDEGQRAVVTINKESKSLGVTEGSRDIQVCVWSHCDELCVDSTQDEVYNSVCRGIVDRVLAGYNGCIFCYGQTASGKTYTMYGSQSPPSQMGITYRVADHISSHASARSRTHSFTVTAQFLELYNERLVDLLIDSKQVDDDKDQLEIREHKSQGVYVENATLRQVVDVKDYIALIDEGNSRRTVGETKMNERSSRSHSILTLRVTQYPLDDPLMKVESQIHLIDLAGSERVDSTGAVGQRLKEGALINQSLSALGLVIKKIVDNAQHIPYRDSKLTRILSNSLGGNAVTLLIANLSPASANAFESVSTLRFASRAKHIKNKAMISMDPRSQRIKELMAEVALLRARCASLEAALSAAGKEVPPMSADLATMMQQPIGLDPEQPLGISSSTLAAAAVVAAQNAKDSKKKDSSCNCGWLAAIAPTSKAKVIVWAILLLLLAIWLKVERTTVTYECKKCLIF